jgi:hypothetical protein
MATSIKRIVRRWRRYCRVRPAILPVDLSQAVMTDRSICSGMITDAGAAKRNCHKELDVQSSIGK